MNTKCDTLKTISGFMAGSSLLQDIISVWEWRQEKINKKD